MSAGLFTAASATVTVSAGGIAGFFGATAVLPMFGPVGAALAVGGGIATGIIGMYYYLKAMDPLSPECKIDSVMEI